MRLPGHRRSVIEQIIKAFAGRDSGGGVILSCCKCAIALTPIVCGDRHRYSKPMHQKIATKDLKTGMFIADLDRPWIDTPFLLQGFLLEDAEQLQQLCAQCEWVMIDPQRSVGKDFDAPAKKAATPR